MFNQHSFLVDKLSRDQKPLGAMARFYPSLVGSRPFEPGLICGIPCSNFDSHCHDFYDPSQEAKNSNLFYVSRFHSIMGCLQISASWRITLKKMMILKPEIFAHLRKIQPVCNPFEQECMHEAVTWSTMIPRNKDWATDDALLHTHPTNLVIYDGISRFFAPTHDFEQWFRPLLRRSPGLHRSRPNYNPLLIIIEIPTGRKWMLISHNISAEGCIVLWHMNVNDIPYRTPPTLCSLHERKEERPLLFLPRDLSFSRRMFHAPNSWRRVLSWWVWNGLGCPEGSPDLENGRILVPKWRLRS